MKLSILISIDTRTENNTFGGENLKGCANADFWTHGIFNKVKAFDGFDKEVIVSIDEHHELPDEDLKYIRTLADCVVIRKHTNEVNFNDWNYYRLLQMASGDIIIKFDQDSNIFIKDKQTLENFIKLVEVYDFVSYPSWWTPLPCIDESFDHVWCSTRFFMCKREKLDLAEIKKCFDYDYWTKTYPVNRTCPWMEHWIGSIAKYRNQTVFYPPVDADNMVIFSWGSYSKYTLMRLNEMSYTEIREWLNAHPLGYPNDIHA